MFITAHFYLEALILEGCKVSNKDKAVSLLISLTLFVYYFS